MTRPAFVGSPTVSADDRAWGSDWAVGLCAWVERDGHVILGKGRLELLEAIDRWHSISAAARQMGMSYRRAWLLVQGINEAAGEPLVETATGGHQGGGAASRARGRAAAAVFRELQDQLQQTAAGLLPRLVAPDPATLHLAAAISLQEPLGQLLADFALRQPSLRVRALYGASDELAYHLLAGTPADLFLTAGPEPMDRLEKAGLLRPGTCVALAENTLAASPPPAGSCRCESRPTSTPRRSPASPWPACGSPTRPTFRTADDRSGEVAGQWPAAACQRRRHSPEVVGGRLLEGMFPNHRPDVVGGHRLAVVGDRVQREVVGDRLDLGIGEVAPQHHQHRGEVVLRDAFGIPGLKPVQDLADR